MLIYRESIEKRCGLLPVDIHDDVANFDVALSPPIYTCIQ